MARDYKNRAAPKSKNKPAPGWIWFVSGVMVGLFGAGLVWLKLGQAPGAPPSSATPPVVQESPTPEKKSPSLPPKPRFDFYTVLPEMEVVVPEPEEENAGQVPTSQNEGAATPSKAYMLQLGSFRKHPDADRHKATIALLGIEAKIEKVNNDQGTFHRVLSGPYSDSGQIKELQARLRENRINYLLIKLKR